MSIDVEAARRIPGVLSILLALGCTSITVRPVGTSDRMGHVCIERNPDVLVEDFVPVVRDGLARHGVASEEFVGPAPAHCDSILTYTALRSWDMSPYLSHAEIRVMRAGREIGYGEFHLRGKGGYSVYKWQGTREKMDPVIDRLFGEE
jgi:hypothetical protein